MYIKRDTDYTDRQIERYKQRMKDIHYKETDRHTLYRNIET